MPEYFTPGPAALRALSHPVRLQMLGLLRLDGPATASQLAQRLDLNSGATSYHLRQLAQHGLVEDADDLGDRRERWWRAAQSSTSSKWSEEPEAQALWAGFGQAAVGAQVQNLVRGAAEADEIAAEWQQTATHNDLTLVLTPEQAIVVRDRLHRLVAELVDEHDVPDRQRPPDPSDDRVQYMVQVHAFPRPGQAPRRPQPESRPQPGSRPPESGAGR